MSPALGTLQAMSIIAAASPTSAGRNRHDERTTERTGLTAIITRTSTPKTLMGSCVPTRKSNWSGPSLI